MILNNMQQIRADKTLKRLQAGRRVRNNTMLDLVAGETLITRLHPMALLCSHQLEVKATTHRCTQATLLLPRTVD
jgi:hypothetical protein